MNVVPNGHNCFPFSKSVNVAQYDWFLISISYDQCFHLIDACIQSVLPSYPIFLIDTNFLIYRSHPIDSFNRSHLTYDSIRRWFDPIDIILSMICNCRSDQYQINNAMSIQSLHMNRIKSDPIRSGPQSNLINSICNTSLFTWKTIVPNRQPSDVFTTIWRLHGHPKLIACIDWFIQSTVTSISVCLIDPIHSISIVSILSHWFYPVQSTSSYRLHPTWLILSSLIDSI